MFDKLREVKPEELDSIKLIDRATLLGIWKITPQYLSKLTNHKNEAKRIPSYRLGRKPLFNPAELRWYMEKHRNEPRRRGTK